MHAISCRSARNCYPDGLMKDIKGHLVLLMAPSGSGKRLMVEGLSETVTDSMYFAKTYTSRARRAAEENPNYIFITRDEFEQWVEEDRFVEWANFGGNLYGTSKDDVLEALQEKQIVFKEMELQGVMQMKELVPKEHMTVIYIDAGSWKELKERVLARADIPAEELRLREERYYEEAKFKPEADIVIVNKNGEPEVAQAEFRGVIKKIIDSLA